MKKTKYLLVFSTLLLSQLIMAQQKKSAGPTQEMTADIKKDINTAIWIPFMEAYKDLDLDKFMSIQSKDIITYRHISVESAKFF